MESFREQRCRGCSAIFYVCRRCDRGQAYCGQVCRARGRQRIGDNRIVLHEVVRTDVLAHMALDDKYRLSGAAAELVASTASDSTGPRLAWQAGDDGAFGAMDQVTRVREVVWY